MAIRALDGANNDHDKREHCEIVIHILKLVFFRSTKYNKSSIRNEIQRTQFMTNTFVFTLLIIHLGCVCFDRDKEDRHRVG